MSRSSPRFESLDEWLQWQEQLHPVEIDLGLERAGRVADRLQCCAPAKTVITVAGTNGKGSSVAMLESILLRAGYRTGSYTSPHLMRYNERIRVQGKTVSDQSLCAAFERVDQARADDSLSYFEFGTLAALDIMQREALDVGLLEVGLGGRLDAVNIVDADAVLITSIGIDHVDWLGSDRESIGREKAGIMRASRPAVCADADPPASLVDAATRLGADLRVLGKDFRLSHAGGRNWHWQGDRVSYRQLPMPALSGAHQLANAAGVLMVLEMLAGRLPVPRPAIESGLKWLKLSGRIQRIPGKVEQVLDVSHNVQAAEVLADTLRHLPPAGRVYAVFGSMQDKDSEGFAAILAPLVACWYPVALNSARASVPQRLAETLARVVGETRVIPCTSVADALEKLRQRVQPGDRVLVCGSFHTVAEWAALEPRFN